MASSSVGGLSGAFIPVSEDEGMIAAAEGGTLCLDKLEAMPPQQARAFLMTEAAAVSDGDETVILGSKNPGWFDDKFLADLNTLLQKQGKRGQLTLGNETRNGETGLILAKNGMEISCTFASLLDSRRLDMEADIAAILFPDRPA